MDAMKKYLKQELQVRNFLLQHSYPAVFYLSVWQSNRSCKPLFVFRILLFLSALTIFVSSFAYNIKNGSFAIWGIYLTHWGLTMMTLATGFAFGVSARCYFNGPISGDNRLPWYIKVYWVLYNIAVPLAFLITIFYWSVLYKPGKDGALDTVYDVAIHGLNSLIVFLLLITSSQPSRLLHAYMPVILAIVFFVFTLFYYLGGGVNRDGHPYVYPVLHWKKPGKTIVVGIATALLLLMMHVFVVCLAVARDAIARRFIKPPAPPTFREQPIQYIMDKLKNLNPF